MSYQVALNSDFVGDYKLKEMVYNKGKHCINKDKKTTDNKEEVITGIGRREHLILTSLLTRK